MLRANPPGNKIIKKTIDKIPNLCYNKTIQEREEITMGKPTTIATVKIKILRDGNGNAVKIIKIRG